MTEDKDSYIPDDDVGNKKSYTLSEAVELIRKRQEWNDNINDG